MATSDVPRGRFTERKLVLMMVDLAGSSRAMSGKDAVDIARLINSFYASCDDVVERHGGRVATFLGDGCLAVFPERHGEQAVNAALELRDGVSDLCREFDVDIDLGSNVHQAVVAEGHFEPDGRYNVIGTGVIHTFRMGAGSGIRISEPVYRQLPSDRRTPWHKNRPPATYTLSTT